MSWPDPYGKATKALPDILGPLNINHEGDKLLPDNDMAEVAPGWAQGKESKDPAGLLIKTGK